MPKSNQDIIDAIYDLEQRVKDIESDVEKIKSEVTATTGTKKFKVAERVTDKNGNTVVKYHNETARAVGKEVKDRNSVQTTEMEQILADNGVDVSKPTVLNIMRRYAREMDRFKALEPKKGIRKSVHLRYVG
jgi:hypothetical protein